MKLLPRWMTRRVALALLILGVLMVAMALWAYGSKTIGSICEDGWESSSTAGGRCSGHGGVEENIVADTLLGQQPVGWIGWTQWPVLLFGAAGAITGLIGLGATSALVMNPPRTGRMDPDRSQPERPNHLQREPPKPFAGEALDFAIEIRRRAKGYSVEVTTPAGQSLRVLRNEPLPEDRGIEELEALVAAAGKRRFGSRQAKAVEAFGTRLFDAILVDAAERAFRDSMDFVRANNATLRIVLQVDGDFADIPWEYMYDADRGAFLARSRETSIVRLLPTTDSTRSQEDISCLRILSMAASPRDTPSLDITTEQDRVRGALASSIDAGLVELQFVDGGSLAALNRSLTEFQPHVFHFAGHGDWDADRDDGVIMFEDEAGFRQPVTGLDLGTVLNRRELRLVIFNSCHAATPSKRDRFAGITSSLVAQGVPAAVGMQFPFDDKAAITFGTTLLGELGAGAAIDSAVTEARIAVFTQRNNVEWGTPVLTTRVPVEQILPRANPHAKPARSSVA